jgi:hypothetical protein
MKIVRHTLAVLAVFALAACLPPTTSHPVGSTVGFKTDPSLEGLWQTGPDSDGRVLYYHLLDTKNGTMFAVLVPNRAGDANVVMLSLKTARFGSFGFLNVRWMLDPKHELPGQSPGTIPVLYRFDGKDKLEIFIPDEGATDAAIDAHKIAGIKDNGTTDHTTLIAANGPALDQFFRSPAGLALYKKPFAVLTRMK